ncbi:MAG: YihY/virulence factor BrkB family protein [Nanobdellota archaeon]
MFFKEQHIVSVWSFVVRIFKNTFEEVYKKNIAWLSAALVFYILLSMGPLLVILFELVQLFLQSSTVLETVRELSVSLIGSSATSFLSELASSFHLLESNIALLIGSIIVLFFLGSQSIVHLKQSIDVIYKTSRPMNFSITSFFKRNLIGFISVFLLGLGLVVFIISKMILFSIQSFLANHLSFLSLPSIINTLLSFLILLFIFGFFVLVYYVLSERKIRFSSAIFGALVSTLLFLVGGVIVGYYISIAPLFTSYGLASSLFFILLWLYYSAHVILFGAQLSYSHHKLLS